MIVKIDISNIIKEHIKTLKNVDSEDVSFIDLSIFYGIPLALSIFCFYLCVSLSNEAFNLSVTFFGIFIALLLNIQVAIFGIFQRKWVPPKDARIAEIQERSIKDRILLIAELNSNISYMILLSCFALAFFLVFFVNKLTIGIYPAFSIFLYSHFFFTLLMVVKRSHALFQREYEENF